VGGITRKELGVTTATWRQHSIARVLWRAGIMLWRKSLTNAAQVRALCGGRSGTHIDAAFAPPKILLAASTLLMRWKGRSFVKA
jgi:hypothetical protein